MIHIRRSQERGHANHGWLDSFHTFSFADYYDPKFMGYSVLRVINEDKIEGSAGFPTHGHRDMEIITYIISGALEHKDSLGNASKILPGEVQRMTAGRGVRHSEYNSLTSEETHLLQIWIQPNAPNLDPGYEQRSYDKDKAKQGPVLVASGKREQNVTGNSGPVFLNQDIELFVCQADVEGRHVVSLKKDRCLWLQVVKGQLMVENNQVLKSGDGAAISDLSEVFLNWQAQTEYLLFDLPK
jgi:redox-sensitive bicupin YhaK (pirin superfamily)